MSDKKIDILIADKHFLVRFGLTKMLTNYSEMNVIGDTDSYDELHKLIIEENPDVLIIGLNIKGESIIPALDLIMKNHPELKILILDTNEQVNDIVQILKLGVHGYILKQCDEQEIVDAIHAILKGKNFFCSNVLKLNNDDVSCCGDELCKHSFVNLSDRELEVLELISQGLTNNEIADKIFLSSHTIATHRKNLMKKFKAKNNVDLVISAIKENFIAP